MSEKVTWKVEAKTDGLTWSDITEYVQNLSINIGKPDDVDSFDIGTANLSLINIDGRFDPESANNFYNSPTRINFCNNPSPVDTAGTSTWTLGTVGVSSTLGTALLINGANNFANEPVSFGSPSYREYRVKTENKNNSFFNNDIFTWNYIEPKKLGIEIQTGDYWTVATKFAASNIPTALPIESWPIYPVVGIRILNSNFEIIDMYQKPLTEKDKTGDFYHSTFEIVNPLVDATYINTTLGAIYYGDQTNSLYPQLEFSNILLEKNKKFDGYFDGDTTNATWYGDSNLSPSILSVNKAFDINTEIRIKASNDGVYFYPKFVGNINNATYTEDVEGYPIVNFQITDKTAFLNNNFFYKSVYQNEVLYQDFLDIEDVTFVGDIENGFFFLVQSPYFRRYYFPFDKITDREVIKTKSIRYSNLNAVTPNCTKEIMYLNQFELYESVNGYNNGIAILNEKAFFDQQERILPNLNQSTLYVASGDVDAVWGGDLFGIPGANPNRSFAFSAWYKLVNIPSGGLRIFDTTLPRDETSTNLATEFFSSLAVFVNSDGSLTFQTQRPSTGATTSVSTDINTIDITQPLHLAILVPDSRGDSSGIYASIWVNGKLVTELNQFVNVQDSSIKGSEAGVIRFLATAGGSYYISDMLYQKLDFQSSEYQPNFIDAYNAGIGITYRNLNELTDFTNAASLIDVIAPPVRFDTNETGSEVLVEPLSDSITVKNNLENLSLVTDGYVSIDYNDNKPRLLSRWYLNENAQKTEWIFNNDNVQPNEIRFRTLTYERSNDQVINQIISTNPDRSDYFTKESLGQPITITTTNNESETRYGSRQKTLQTTNVKQAVNEGYGRWKTDALGFIDNKVKGIFIEDGLIKNAEAIANVKIGQTAIINRTLLDASISTKRYRITGINWSASVDRTNCELSLLDLEKEQMPLIDEANVDEMRLGY
jgi:hypothetical protein